MLSWGAPAPLTSARLMSASFDILVCSTEVALDSARVWNITNLFVVVQAPSTLTGSKVLYWLILGAFVYLVSITRVYTG